MKTPQPSLRDKYEAQLTALEAKRVSVGCRNLASLERLVAKYRADIRVIEELEEKTRRLLRWLDIPAASP